MSVLVVSVVGAQCGVELESGAYSTEHRFPFSRRGHCAAPLHRFPWVPQFSSPLPTWRSSCWVSYGVVGYLVSLWNGNGGILTWGIITCGTVVRLRALAATLSRSGLETARLSAAR